MLLETFIKGIEILDKTEISTVAVGRIFIVSAIWVILITVIGTKLSNEFGEWSGNIFVLIISAITLVIGVKVGAEPTGKYEYKVTITDEVSLNEFNEKYEITDQEGKIYTIRFKE